MLLAKNKAEIFKIDYQVRQSLEKRGFEPPDYVDMVLELTGESDAEGTKFCFPRSVDKILYPILSAEFGEDDVGELYSGTEKLCEFGKNAPMKAFVCAAMLYDTFILIKSKNPPKKAKFAVRIYSPEKRDEVVKKHSETMTGGREYMYGSGFCVASFN